MRHDVFKLLREYREVGEKFDVVLDRLSLLRARPSCWAPAAAGDINMLAFQLLAPGGVLLTYSCSWPVE